MQLVPAEVEDFDDRCIRLIELFGAYSVSEMLHAKGAWHMHGVARCMHEFAWHMKRVHGECMELHVTCMELHGAWEGCRVNVWSCMSHAKTFLSC